MAAATFDAGERAPYGVLGRKSLPGNQAGTVGRFIAAGYLWREREEQLVQALLGEESPHQLRPTFHQDDLALAHGADRLQDRLGAEGASLLDRCNLHQLPKRMC